MMLQKKESNLYQVKKELPHSWIYTADTIIGLSITCSEILLSTKKMTNFKISVGYTLFLK